MDDNAQVKRPDSEDKMHYLQQLTIYLYFFNYFVLFTDISIFAKIFEQ